MKPFEQEHAARLRPYLPECMVLLACNGAFPLDGPCRIEACGSGVRNTVYGGTGSGEVHSRRLISIEEGLENAGFTIVNRGWSDQYARYLETAKKGFHAEVKRRARAQQINYIAACIGAVVTPPEYEIELDLTADAAIYVVSRLSGEGSDRTATKGDFQLTDSEVRDILTLNAAYDRFMLIINAGGPVDLSPVAHVGNILVASQLGAETGAAVADVLLGASYPSGKLATTWSAYEDYCPVGDFAKKDDTRYREGIFVGYRYFEAVDKKPLFPFGYGMGFTTFSLGISGCSCEGSMVAVSAQVLNTGNRNGKETVQLYAACPSGKLVREKKALVGFAKTPELAPGESTQLDLTFDVRDLAGFDISRAAYILEPGVYTILSGTSSENVQPCAYFEIGEEVIVRKVKNLMGAPDFADETFDNATGRTSMTPVLDGLPKLHIDPHSLRTETIAYGLQDEKALADCREGGACEFDLEALSDADLAYLGIGKFNPKGGILNVIGDASQDVAGAAGDSTSQLEGKGVPSLVMADGPAGVRLARQYYEDSAGKHAVGASIPESVIAALPPFVSWILARNSKPKAGIELHEQYATSLPIATAIAQSFNLDFAEVCGDIVGSEMDEYGIDLWLAPALNIHRNVLCGRNFEYYSEDPLISGKFAAATTRGVQTHRGRGVTIKHVAANNQETNRYANNSMVGERALREIYLRGFEICIREAAPRAVMTSYNLINGIHTSESRDLTEILRDEFGFDGIIMTDWIAGGVFLSGKTKYPSPDPAKTAAAGCSLFMPGSKGDYAKLLAGLNAGAVSREQLRLNAAYLIREAMRLKG